jgi:hypothetical protein
MTKAQWTQWFLDYLHLRIIDCTDAYDGSIMLQMAYEIEERTEIAY